MNLSGKVLLSEPQTSRIWSPIDEVQHKLTIKSMNAHNNFSDSVLSTGFWYFTAFNRKPYFSERYIFTELDNISPVRVRVSD